MKRSEALERRKDQATSKKSAQKSSGIGTWPIVGGAALVLVAAAVIVAFPDVKRYVKISTM